MLLGKVSLSKNEQILNTHLSHLVTLVVVVAVVVDYVVVVVDDVNDVVVFVAPLQH